mgnify:CR=1 FL=1
MKAYFDSIEKEVPEQLQQVFLNRRDTAVITIDMHDGHLSTDPDCPCPSPRGREIIEPLNHFMNEARALGLPIINWSVDTQDWKYRDAAHVKQVIVEQAGDGDVVLMHDLYPTSVQGALDAIDELQKRTDKTYAFVTVSQLAAIHGITLEPGVVYNGLSDKVAQEIKDGTYSPAEFT